MLLEISRTRLQEILDNRYPEYKETFETIDQLLDGDLDLSIAKLEGCSIVVEKDKIYLVDPEKDWEILNRIGALEEKEHMILYDKHGKFHDGGDDFDYGGSFVGMLADLIKIELKKEYRS